MSRRRADLSLFTVAGALTALHLALWLACALGLPWSRPLTVALWLGLAAVVAVVLRHVSRLRSPAALLGLAACGVLALASWQGWNVHPDWAFHWGPKAQRFALAEGIDLAYLSRPWNAHAHPDYPLLIPDLTASLALASGVAVTPRVGAVVTLAFAALWFVALRALAFRLTSSRYAAEAAWLTAAWSVTMFGTGFRQAAGADLPFACAVTLGALALAAPRDELRRSGWAPDLAVGIAAALASQIKFEGSVFALVLVALWLARRAVHAAPRLRRKHLLRAVYGAAVLPGLTVAAWLLWNQHHGLFQPSNSGALELGRLDTVARGLWRAAAERAWHGVPFLLVALPWLCFRGGPGLRRGAGRWPALLLAGQLAAYVGVYLTTPVDLDLLLLTSGPRLLFHLVPTFLVLLVVALGSENQLQTLSETDPVSTPVSVDAVSLSDEPVSPTFLA